LTYTETTQTAERAELLRSVTVPKKQTVNTYDIEELADRAANSTIEGFVAQDRHDFDGASLQFSIMLQTMFPEFESERLLKASQYYVNALLVQSKVKDDRPDPFARMHDERWEFVRTELANMCRILELPTSFGIETEEFWRYAAGRDDGFVKHIIEFHRALVRRLTGSEKYFSSLAGLYFAGVSLHNEHTDYSLAKGREAMKLYYRILFQVINKEDRA